MAKLTSYSAITSPALTDILYLVSDPTGTPVSKKVTVASLLSELVANDLTLPITTSLTGIIYKATDLFIHDFADPTSLGGNTFVGVGAGNLTMGPAGGAATLGSWNTGFGYQSLRGLTTGFQNVGMGDWTFASATTAWQNTAIGSQALRSIVDGNTTTAVGAQAGYSNTAGYENTFVGANSGFSNTVGIANSAFGEESLKNNINGNQNVALGMYALYTGTGSLNVGLGYQAGFWETGSNKLFIDNSQRTNEADGRAKALIYGIFAADPANQYLTINGNLVLPTKGAFAANDKYLVVDASGNVHVSALGPAS